MNLVGRNFHVLPPHDVVYALRVKEKGTKQTKLTVKHDNIVYRRVNHTVSP